MSLTAKCKKKRSCREELNQHATIETLGGRRPKTFEEFVREEQSAFNGLSQ